MTSLGELRHRVAFDRRQDVEDEYGNTQSSFIEQFTCAAAFKTPPGHEQVLANRLSGVQPVTITVRRSSQTKLIRADWRARDVRSDPDPAKQTVYAITADPTNPDDKNKFLAIPATSGIAT